LGEHKRWREPRRCPCAFVAGQDLRNKCASLVDTRAESEIANDYALGRWRYVTRTFEMCSFGTVTQALFLPLDAPTRDFYLDSGDDL
jgi:hypothetical protein